ncbi:L,D-transpeptidase [Kitasatospora griseola]|uniref:L,D-transpeptidase n=1 Tax=Kitasatospora griseola TaxID=2064 RepID=UPI00381F1BA4
MAKLGPGVVVGGLTLSALAVIGLLAFQANGAASRAVAAGPSSSASAPTAASPAASEKPTAPPLPADSGAGLRVVFSLKDRQVWLVDPKKTEQVVASFKVAPGSALPNPGAYTVYSRTAAGTGTDGRQIEHVVRFTQQQGTVFGFSALVDENAPAPSMDPKTKTGGIRASRSDGQVLWDFAPNGTRVIVVA